MELDRAGKAFPDYLGQDRKLLAQDHKVLLVAERVEASPGLLRLEIPLTGFRITLVRGRRMGKAVLVMSHHPLSESFTS